MSPLARICKCRDCGNLGGPRATILEESGVGRAPHSANVVQVLAEGVGEWPSSGEMFIGFTFGAAVMENVFGRQMRLECFQMLLE